ncbi:arabinosyltransferase C [Saccharopolyspora kobensis]|uniref:Arabinosyltransferase C n=1 Tax=Saccharopolyspora kobensis TaxID=146035 RepID=A0A1H6DGN4_9PSEU|nr:arabinosyltransferase domain-containing protein [Saccharopolyspora kobensis]SEG83933.1 arabinosyltransferase C [Saccharopolyspora kobensis]SFE34722.1 arabinosyltransferase C [Saccharopolyspora kobensis]
MADRAGAAELDRPLPAPTPRERRFPGAVGLLVGMLGVLVALAVPLAPVITQQVTATWPKAGQLPESTLAFVVPYHPAEGQVRIPCPVVRAGQQRAAPTTLVASRPPGQPTEGFAVTTANDHVIALIGGREALRAPITAACDVAIDADSTGSRARIGDRAVELPGVRVRDIVAFATDLEPEQATGLQVRVTTANWFENSPTTTKNLLVTTQIVLVLLAFATLLAHDRSRRKHAISMEIEPPISIEIADRRRVAARHSDGASDGGAISMEIRRPISIEIASRGRSPVLGRLVDVGLFIVLAGWWVVGPTTPDDSFAAMTVRNGLLTGDIGNYYRWENASEAPFTLVQHLLEPVAAWSANPLALRIPSVVAAALTWLVLSRGILGAVLPEHSRLGSVRLLAAVSFLAWWLPFGLGVRPEPFEALGLAAVLACVLQAVRRDRVAWLGLAALAAGLSVAVNPMGITALAPFAVLAPQLRRLLSVPVVALLGGIAAVGVVVMFADQSLFGVRKATELHAHYGPDVPWFQEVLRYQYLLGFDLQGDIARRAPVLLTALIAGYSGLLLLRGARRLPGMALAHVPPLCLLLSVLLMIATPSKWTHYFGALAGVGAATLTAGAVLITFAARHLARDRVVLVAGGLCTALAALAAALAFAGKNNWFLHSQFGVPWGEQPVRPLNNPAWWLLAVAAALAVSVLSGRTGRARRLLVRIPALVGVGAVGVTVAIVLGSFVLAPIRQADAYSIGGQGLAALSGGSCGIADHVVATPDVPGGAPASNGPAESYGFSAGTGHAQEFAPPEGVNEFWGSLGGGQISTGELTTGWYSLPALAPDQELAVAVAGRSGDGNRVALEFASPTGVLGEHVLDDTWLDADERPAYPADHVVPDRPQDHPAWRDLPVPARDIPAGATAVRIRAVDGTTDPAGWLAVAGPRVRNVVPLPEYLRGEAPVLVDWSMTWNAPCLQDVPRVAGGLVEPPAHLVIPPSGTGFGGSAAYVRDIGGVFAGVREVGHQKEVPTRPLGVEKTPEYSEWGHLIEVHYPMPGNEYDVQRVPVPRWGWRGE